ncbi:MAG: FIST C-terminal domain-containing protein [Flavobacteriales bacterium]|nr:FIST C-terminal domain-containing protein [Flavobacteriales bacterium]
MKALQLNWSQENGWSGAIPTSNSDENVQFVLVFGGVDEVVKKERYEELRTFFPKANIVMSSTAGEIVDDRLQDESLIATALSYQKTKLKFVEFNIQDFDSCHACGEAIQKELLSDDLNHVLVISDGGMVNGDQLVAGINDGLPSDVIVTGGLAADAGRFDKTYVGLNKVPASGNIVAIGHYGSDLVVSHGSMGGWDEFGPIRTVTKSTDNVLFELDGQPALSVYKKYLGDKADELPGAALLFPLSLYTQDGKVQLVRTILSIDEEVGSMTFAGDLPQGSEVRFMMANFDRLIDGAAEAAEAAEASLNLKQTEDPEFVLMISCIGRKIVLDQRVEEELESVKEIFGEDAIYTGFYSNGEISPFVEGVACSLHNQTMTITTYKEKS